MIDIPVSKKDLNGSQFEIMVQNMTLRAMDGDVSHNERCKALLFTIIDH